MERFTFRGAELLGSLWGLSELDEQKKMTIKYEIESHLNYIEEAIKFVVPKTVTGQSNSSGTTID